MLASTRIAAALCIARFMAFLIEPSTHALLQLPRVLLPTDLQRRISHDVSINFIPIPKLRDSILHKSANCLMILSEYEYRVNWKGSWGDIGGATLHKKGNWEYDPKVRMQEHVQGNAHNKQKKSPEAVSFDSTTGRRLITEAYEKFCWDHQNWSVKKEILQIWPALSGHIMLHWNWYWENTSTKCVSSAWGYSSAIGGFSVGACVCWKPMCITDSEFSKTSARCASGFSCRSLAPTKHEIRNINFTTLLGFWLKWINSVWSFVSPHILKRASCAK